MQAVARGWLRNQNFEALGVKTHSYGDYKYEVGLNPVVDEHYIKEYTPIGDQGNLGSCVGNGIADAMEILIGNSGQGVVQLSRLFVYWIGRHKHGDENKDSGTYISLASAAVQQHGIAPESLWGYDISRFKEQPDTSVFEAASDYKVRGVLTIAPTANVISNVAHSLAQNHPVVFGTNVGAEFMQYMNKPNDDSKVFDAPSRSEGGHCMILVGYRKRWSGQYEFCVRNSWSEEWGMKGHAFISESYLKNPMTSDLTVLTRTISL